MIYVQPTHPSPPRLVLVLHIASASTFDFGHNIPLDISILACFLPGPIPHLNTSPHLNTNPHLNTCTMPSKTQFRMMRTALTRHKPKSWSSATTNLTRKSTSSLLNLSCHTLNPPSFLPGTPVSNLPSKYHQHTCE